MENKENTTLAIDVVCKNLKSNLDWHDSSSENNSPRVLSHGLFNIWSTTHVAEELTQNWWLN